MSDKEFEARVFELLWNLTELYPAGNGPSCASTAERITNLARGVDWSPDEQASKD